MTTKHYPELEANPDFAKLEEGVLSFWKENQTFEKSVTNRPEKKADGSSNAYVFYDGPPFANGLPHYGHLLTGYVKDAIARYHTMKGSRVERRFGWDCHGLPAEMGAEKELGISGRAAITTYGIGKFNEYCRTSVMKYTKEWEYYVTRQGRWVDFKNDYKTMDTPYMESCLWAFKELYSKGLIYESMRVMPYSWAAESPVSNFETRIDNATREREDKAAVVAFRLKQKPVGGVESGLDIPATGNYYLLAWTTTPWTLPSNLALAVSKEIKYEAVLVQKDTQCFKTGDYVILANNKFGYYAKELGIEGKSEGLLNPTTPPFLKGADLIGLTYEPLFPYFANTPKAFRVLDGSEFVTDGDGTGIVHMAPGFGEVDQKCCADNGIEVMVPVDEKGKFTADIYDLPDLKLHGLVVVPDTRIAEADIVVSEEDKAQHIAAKDIAKYGLANMRIVRWLKANGALVKDEPYKHNYPHCWRTDTPLIYRAMSSWYVNVQKIKANMAANNMTINWIPDHIQSGQMGKGIESAPDWSISRNRFWGTPIPIWKSESGNIHVCGSIEEIEKLSGVKVDDLHRPFIDSVVLKIDGEEYTRIADVFDCWFESGSMPYAQMHYMGEQTKDKALKKRFEESFPADFITEYIAQTRGWFYTLQVLSAALFGKAPFKNVICHGVVIDEETGLKYSKRLKNYRDPKEVMDQYGADALRWMMLSSPVMRGSDLGVDPDGKFIRDVVRLNIKPMWSAFNFFTLYANADGVKAKLVTSSDNMLDRYILAKAKAAVLKVEASMDAYDTPGATEAITQFFDVLNNWYIRRSRPRFWGEGMTTDKQAAYDTLFTVLNLMCIACAPLLPFVSEAVYRGLNGEASSVHLQDFADVSGIDSAVELVADMDWVQDICNAGSAVRNKQNIRNRQPLQSLTIYGKNPILIRYWASNTEKDNLRWDVMRRIIEEELNLKMVISTSDSGTLEAAATKKLQINSQILGKRLPEKMKQILPASKKGEWEFAKGAIGIEIAGEILKAGEYVIALEPKPEFKNSSSPLSTNDALVVLDLTITPELEAEGRARDLVRMIQQARKDAGLNVGDRITLALDVPADFKAAL
ncbi:MAG: isoleucine--tRNA ligase, partial [Rickettsiales bacterium]|nr:isoleucine--tRNA ligase [Rickettsiales bacterium]